MKRRVFIRLTCALALVPFAGTAAESGDEPLRRLRERLAGASRRTVEMLGRQDGFFANPAARIGLHRNLARAEKFLRGMGYGPVLDGVLLAMNRTAELAVPDLGRLLEESIRTLNPEDSSALLAAPEGLVPGWFRKQSEPRMSQEWLPSIRTWGEKAELRNAYEALARVLGRWGVQGDLSTLEDYVCRKALDGVYRQMAEEVRSARVEPPPSAPAGTQP